jgi:starvation-inducible DNA-binding protein
VLLHIPHRRSARPRYACLYWNVLTKEDTMQRDNSAQLTIDLGIAEDDRKRIVDGLSRLLADAFTLYLKTHNYHWNVTGPQFRTLHLMFEELYNEQWTAIDEIAERIRALGARAPGTYEEFAALTSVQKNAEQPDAGRMVQELAEGQTVVVRTARDLFKVAEAANDQPTCDMLTQRMQIHEKNAWMLRSLLDS